MRPLHGTGQPVVAIIGGGFSGAALCWQLLALGDAIPRIVLIDKSGRFGPGLAYGAAHRSHLLNVRAGNMSIDPVRPNDFVEWLRANGHDDADADTFAQRVVFGEYVETRLADAMRAGGADQLTLVREEAIACRPQERGAAVQLASGAVIEADAVVLALGNAPPKAPAPFDVFGAEVIDPWDRTALAQVAAGDDVLLLGSGLTMIDAAMMLASGPRTGKLYVTSRRGLTPRPHGERRAVCGAPPELPHRMSDALAHVRREAEAAEANGGSWRNVVETLRQNAHTLWPSLPLDAQRRFLRHLRPWWDVHRHRTPGHVAAWLSALGADGAMHVIAGRVGDVARKADGFTISYTPRGRAEQRQFGVKRIVNCTGACADVRAIEAALVKQMLSEGVARSHPNGLGFDVDEHGHVRGANGVARATILALGPLTQGAHWESTSVPDIRARATALISEIARVEALKRRAMLGAFGNVTALSARRRAAPTKS